jgi:nitric oxide reductase NorE protein
VGVWVFIFGDMLIFGVLFVTYLTYRSRHPLLFDHSQESLNQTFGAINTVLLLVSSLFVSMAVRAARRQLRRYARSLIAGAFLCGLAFSGIKIVEYSEKLSHHIHPATNQFFMYYFILTGIHWLHLILGLGVLTVIFILTGKEQPSRHQVAFIEGGACYWHMVDLLWIVLFPLLYLVK